MLSFLANSRFVFAVVGSGLMFGWHLYDKAAAVRSAEEAQADKLQIISLTSLVQELQRREGIARLAGQNLRAKASEAEELAMQAEKELEEYVKTTSQNAECVVDGGFIGKLRNN